MLLLGSAGLTPLQVLQGSSTVAAEILGAQDWLGRLEVGYAADVIGVQGNPLESLDALARLRTVVAAGEIVRR